MGRTVSLVFFWDTAARDGMLPLDADGDVDQL